MLQRDAQHVSNDKKEPGRWYPTHGASPEYVAVCGVCGRTRPAVELALRQLPWGKEEKWACFQGCK
jgi:hypothetical protein